jgi:hypothetical protein
VKVGDCGAWAGGGAAACRGFFKNDGNEKGDFLPGLCGLAADGWLVASAAGFPAAGMAAA